MLVWFVILYLLLSIMIGVYAATRVKNSRDYVVAGRSLPIYIVTATVFATWFGSETVLGISATFLQEGMHGIVADPFGSSLCLILVGLFFARPLYRMRLLTIGDYYRRRYNHVVEVATSICIILSYLGWVSAQMTALGLVFNILSGGQIDNQTGIVIGAAIVLLYTLFGGMWSVALTDFFQMTIIIVGLGYIAWVVGDMAGGAGVVIQHAAEHGKFNLLPALNPRDIVLFLAAWTTMMFGSIPQQDVFQRVMSAKDEKTAVRGSILGGSLYFLFAFIPIFIAYSAFLLMPDMVNRFLSEDAQLILPNLILERMPIFAQVMFFGALLSAIMSTASGTILAPSATFTENILKVFVKFKSDKHQLLAMRVVVVIFTCGIVVFALNSQMSIYAMVENAYQVTLVAAFVPLAAGVYWRPATTQGALLAMILGIVTWLGLSYADPDGFWPPQFAGLLMSIAGMVVGSLSPKQLVHRGHHEPRHEPAT
ncbi:MAG: sodium:solute symporter family protein [Gallionellaceae bacterium]|nr:sodium:solute symporter family protein [Gallionellaceae bacterium]